MLLEQRRPTTRSTLSHTSHFVRVEDNIDHLHKKEERTLTKNVDTLAKDARRASRYMDMEQRKLMRKSSYVMLNPAITIPAQVLRQEVERKQENLQVVLYGGITKFNGTKCNKERRQGVVQRPATTFRPTLAKQGNCDVMTDIKSIANQAINDLDDKRRRYLATRQTSNPNTRRHIKAEKEECIRKSDQVLAQNLSKWHEAFVKSRRTSTTGRKESTVSNRSISCDLPRISSGVSRGSFTSRKSESVLLKRTSCYLPRLS